jgi:hypothetical protein
MVRRPVAMIIRLPVDTLRMMVRRQVAMMVMGPVDTLTMVVKRPVDMIVRGSVDTMTPMVRRRVAMMVIPAATMVRRQVAMMMTSLPVDMMERRQVAMAVRMEVTPVVMVVRKPVTTMAMVVRKEATVRQPLVDLALVHALLHPLQCDLHQPQSYPLHAQQHLQQSILHSIPTVRPHHQHSELHLHCHQPLLPRELQPLDKLLLRALDQLYLLLQLGLLHHHQQPKLVQIIRASLVEGTAILRL